MHVNVISEISMTRTHQCKILVSVMTGLRGNVSGSGKDQAKQELGQNLSGVQKNIEKTLMRMSRREFLTPVTAYSPVNLAIALHFHIWQSNNYSHHIQCWKIIRLILQITAWHVAVQLHVLLGWGFVGNSESGDQLPATANCWFPGHYCKYSNRHRHTYANMDTNTRICKQTNRHINKHQTADQQGCMYCAL